MCILLRCRWCSTLADLFAKSIHTGNPLGERASGRDGRELLLRLGGAAVQKLTSATRRCTGSARNFFCLLLGNFSMSIPYTPDCALPASSPSLGDKVTPPGIGSWAYPLIQKVPSSWLACFCHRSQLPLLPLRLEVNRRVYASPERHHFDKRGCQTWQWSLEIDHHMDHSHGRQMEYLRGFDFLSCPFNEQTYFPVSV